MVSGDHTSVPSRQRAKILLRVPALRMDRKVIFPGIGPMTYFALKYSGSERKNIFGLGAVQTSQASMRDLKPHPLTPEDWQEIIKVPRVREAWGITIENAEEFSKHVYAAKFKFSSGSPGYVGDLYILQGDALTDVPPIALRRRVRA